MMFTIEKKALQWFEKNILTIAVIVITFLSIYVRYNMRGATSKDASTFLLPWYQTIKENGGLACLQSQTGDYNMLYQTIIALFTYLPIEPLYAYKLLSIVFDYLLASAVAYLVFITSNHSHWKSAVAYIITILLPTVCLNSAYWAQCDSIYTFWAILALIFVCKEKYVLSFLALGVSFSFKLQAIFFMPFFLFLYVYKKRFSISYFLIIPCTMVLFSLGGLLHGREIREVFDIYFMQTKSYPAMSLNYPSIWGLLQEVHEEKTFFELKMMAIAITITLLTIYTLILFIKKKQYTNHQLMAFAFLFAYTCVFFLPSMHERYDYPYVILGIILIMLYPRFLPFFVGIAFISLRMYSKYLFDAPKAGELFVLLNLACYIGSSIFILRDSFSQSNVFES